MWLHNTTLTNTKQTQTNIKQTQTNTKKMRTKPKTMQTSFLTILELVFNDHIRGKLANVDALHICLEFPFSNFHPRENNAILDGWIYIS